MIINNDIDISIYNASVSSKLIQPRAIILNSANVKENYFVINEDEEVNDSYKEYKPSKTYMPQSKEIEDDVNMKDSNKEEPEEEEGIERAKNKKKKKMQRVLIRRRKKERIDIRKKERMLIKILKIKMKRR